MRLKRICIPSPNDGVEQECVYLPEEIIDRLQSFWEEEKMNGVKEWLL